MIIVLVVLIVIVAGLGLTILIGAWLFKRTAIGKGYGDLVSENERE